MRLFLVICSSHGFYCLKPQRIAFSAVRKNPIENVPHCVASNNPKLMRGLRPPADACEIHNFDKKKLLSKLIEWRYLGKKTVLVLILITNVFSMLVPHVLSLLGAVFPAWGRALQIIRGLNLMLYYLRKVCTNFNLSHYILNKV